MDYYHLEIYKRIDFMYKLATKAENLNANIIYIDRNTLAVKRFHPLVYWPVEDSAACSLRYDEKHKYYKPALMNEDSWISLSNNRDEYTNDPYYHIWQAWNLCRAKVYELFCYHYKFSPNGYCDIARFLKKHYDVLAYHDASKLWIYSNEKALQDKYIRIQYATNINNALFQDTRN